MCMVSYSKAAMERPTKVQEVMLRAMAKEIRWYQAAEIIGISDRHMRRWRKRYEEFGYDGSSCCTFSRASQTQQAISHDLRHQRGFVSGALG